MLNLMLLGSFLCLAVVAVLALLKTPINYNKTISWHIAQSNLTSLVTKILLPIAGLLLIVWSIASQLPVITTVSLVSIGVGFAILGVVTYGRSRKGDKLHDIAVWTIALITLMLVVIVMISRRDMLDIYTLTLMLACIYVVRYAKGIQRYGSLLIAEAVLFIIFYAYLLTL